MKQPSHTKVRRVPHTSEWILMCLGHASLSWHWQIRDTFGGIPRIRVTPSHPFEVIWIGFSILSHLFMRSPIDGHPHVRFQKNRYVRHLLCAKSIVTQIQLDVRVIILYYMCVYIYICFILDFIKLWNNKSYYIILFCIILKYMVLFYIIHDKLFYIVYLFFF